MKPLSTFITAVVLTVMLGFVNANFVRKPTSSQTAQVLKAYNIDSFLLKPFNLYKFKQKEGGSNSGGAKRRAYHYQPTYKGIYYSFFLFHSGEYLGDRKDRRLHSLEGFEITTYKPVGKYQGQYLDPNEELIEVSARSNNINVPELAVVGLDSTLAVKKYGSKYYMHNGCMIYTYNDRALILSLNGRTITWLKYVHLAAPLVKGNAPGGLLLWE